ncbi:hypothetical protein BaRGS_00020620 [Batillaria attramentaria]|uniref:Uncharacterized protein n=1 Tax=Batillaria attramentaria TaxID=370345 RepID=A0ABD0KMC1_9CAEN
MKHGKALDTRERSRNMNRDHETRTRGLRRRKETATERRGEKERLEDGEREIESGGACGGPRERRSALSGARLQHRFVSFSCFFVSKLAVLDLTKFVPGSRSDQLCQVLRIVEIVFCSYSCRTGVLARSPPQSQIMACPSRVENFRVTVVCLKLLAG